MISVKAINNKRCISLLCKLSKVESQTFKKYKII